MGLGLMLSAHRGGGLCQAITPQVPCSWLQTGPSRLGVDTVDMHLEEALRSPQPPVQSNCWGSMNFRKTGGTHCPFFVSRSGIMHNPGLIGHLSLHLGARKVRKPQGTARVSLPWTWFLLEKLGKTLSRRVSMALMKIYSPPRPRHPQEMDCWLNCHF